LMSKLDAKREKITDLLTYIEERLTELEEEKEELKEYQKNDRERRCLEYALHQKELDDVTGTLDNVRESVGPGLTKSADVSGRGGEAE
jgi:structural maintenance of chromosome 3 (chondroitin sulfate proteoglycan 6)